MDLEFEICDLKLEIYEAHICRFWALLIICGSVVVKSAISILQGICKAEIGNTDQLSVASLQLPVRFSPLAVDMGGVS